MSSISQLYQEALNFESENKLEEAVTTLERAAEMLEQIDPSHLTFNIFYHLGLNASGLEEYEKAIFAYQNAIEACPEEKYLWLPYYGIGFAYSNMEQLSKSIEPYTIALKYCPEATPSYYAHMEIADAYQEALQIDKVIEHQEAAFKIAKDNQLFNDLMNVTHELSSIYLEFDEEEKGRDLLQFGLLQAREQKKQDWERLFIGNLSTAYLGTGELDLAKQMSEELLEIAKVTDEIDDWTTAYNNLAMYHRSQGEYDQGIKYLQKAIEIEDNPISKAIALRNLSSFYQEVGDTNTALYHLHVALEIVETEKHWEKIIKYRSHAADLYFAKEHYPKAIEYYEAALEAYQNYPEGEAIIELLTHIGSSWSRLDEFEKGLEYIEQALEKAESIKTSDRILSITHNALAGMYLREEYFEEAKEYFDLSLRLDDDPEDMVVIFNMAAFYHLIGEYDTAEDLIMQAIESYEEQRAKLIGFDRKLFDNRNGSLYEYLAAIKARKGEAWKALEAIEFLKSRAMLEDFNFAQSIDFQNIKSLIQTDEAVLYFLNTLHNKPLLICITQEGINTVFLSLERLRDSLSDFEKKIDRYWDRIREANKDGAVYAKANIPNPGWFDLLILYYRHRLLQDPRFWSSKKTQTKRFAQRLYDHLILPVSEHLIDKTKLTIIPDRSIHLMPFETLVGSGGNYLIEKYAINYLPNLSLRSILANRMYLFEKTGMAFGITKYPTLEVKSIEPLKDFTSIPLLRAKINAVIEQQENPDYFYQAVGIKDWPDLPAIQQELAYLKDTLNMETIQSEKLSPNWLRQQSEHGLLKQHRILHFANHGITVPAIPELSALVLNKDGSGNRYLNTDDVSKLEIEADLVYLSACETGLGEIIPSIGVSGLSQAFLMAGAKSVQVSLWEIHDEFSAKLVECFYEILLENNWDYNEALAITKRKSITGELGEALKNPLYWASLIRIA